jgi:hypothetical protein
MLPTNPTIHYSRLLRGKLPTIRSLLLLPIACAVTALSSCDGESEIEPIPIVSLDTKPVGDGLSVIGYALLGAAVVIVLGKMIR